MISFVSPVSDDSSTVISPSIKYPSAGTLSPVSNITISLTTTSLIGISLISLFLLTRHLILDASICNFLKACSLPYSDIVDIKEAIKIAITIPTVSYQSKSLIKNTILIPKAIIKIRIIGSPNDSNNFFKKLTLSIFSKALLPYVSLLLITSSSVKPCFILSPILKYMYKLSFLEMV